MSSFLEIGEIVESIPNSIKVVTTPNAISASKVLPKAVSKNRETGKGGNMLAWFVFLAVVAGGAYVYYKKKKNEDTIISNKL